MFSKGQVMLTLRLFLDTSQCMLIEPLIFFAKKTLEFLFQDKKIFQG